MTGPGRAITITPAASILAPLLALLLLGCLAPAGAAGDIDEIGWLRVESAPSGLVVLVDGDSVGTTPLAEAPLDAGLHTVGLLPCGRRTFSTRILTRSVEIRPGEITGLSLSYPRTVNITSTPFGASAFLDGRYVGRTPFLLELPGEGGGDLELRLPGHDPVRVTVDVLGASGAHWSAVLGSRPEIPSHEVTRLERSGWPWWRYGLLGGAAAGALLGLVLKVEADRAYDDYKTTGSLARQKRLLDRAEEYDNYSLASWVAAEAFLGAALALLIHDQIIARKPPPAAEAP